jgi:hypothetical protein
MSNIHTIEELRELQAMPLLAKELLTRSRIHEWQVNSNWGIEKGVVSFSGGKDSTVLLHMCRKLYPDIPAVFSNTGLEYPEIQSFVRKHDNVTIVRPKMQFKEVIQKYGYPLIGKEVAEAIHYARKIRPSTERERERDAQPNESKRSYVGDGLQTNGTLGAQTRWKRLEIRGGADPTVYQDKLCEEPKNNTQRSNARSRGDGCYWQWGYL